MIHDNTGEETVKYAVVQDDVSVTTCKHEDLKEEWQWVGAKKVLATFFITGKQDRAHAAISKVHDGYFKAKNKTDYLKSVNGKTFTDAGVKKLTNKQIK